MLQCTMASRDAHLTEMLAYVDARGQRVRIPSGPCIIEADARSTTLRWGALNQQAVPLQADMLDGLVSAGIVEFEQPMPSGRPRRRAG